GGKGIDLGITFVAEQEKTKPSGEGDNAPEIGKVGDRALRVRRRGNEERDGAREEVFRERFEIGKKARRCRGRQVDWFAVRRHRTPGISRVKRMGEEDRRRAAAPAAPARCSDCREEQAFP